MFTKKMKKEREREREVPSYQSRKEAENITTAPTYI
jgi:hypothetical protein